MSGWLWVGIVGECVGTCENGYVCRGVSVCVCGGGGGGELVDG